MTLMSVATHAMATAAMPLTSRLIRLLAASLVGLVASGLCAPLPWLPQENETEQDWLPSKAAALLTVFFLILVPKVLNADA